MKWLKPYLRAQEGTSTVEFVILFPAFVLVLLASFESGLLMLRDVFLERGIDLAVRELRLGSPGAPTNEDELKTLICNKAMFLSKCTSTLRLELVQVDLSNFDAPTAAPTCTQRDKMNQPSTAYTPGAPQTLMLLRACMIFDPWFPTTGLGLRMPKDNTGAYSLIAASAFVIEPK